MLLFNLTGTDFVKTLNSVTNRECLCPTVKNFTYRFLIVIDHILSYNLITFDIGQLGQGTIAHSNENDRSMFEKQNLLNKKTS